MAIYQRRWLESGDDIGEPGPLPEDLRGSLSDEDLEHLSDLNPAPHYDGQGFFRVADPEPEPVRERWIHKAIFKLRLTMTERKAIRASAKSDEDVEDVDDLLNSADLVDLDSEALVNGLALLVFKGLLGSERPDQLRGLSEA